MRIAFFTHSLLSDWNHGNAHFLRGLGAELARAGHDVVAYEPRSAWSVVNLVRAHGEAPLRAVRRSYPMLRFARYELDTVDLERTLDGVDLAVVHEWNAPELVRALGRLRSRSRDLRLLFHDTHHRAVSAPAEMARYDLSNFDGVLAFGEAIRRIYLREGWAERVFTFHEAADVRLFRPMPDQPKESDLVWIGNFGDEERTRELEEFLLEPVASLGISARAYGVRYPAPVLASLARSGIEYGGWLANYETPAAFARHRVTIHVPRRPYARALPGIPTIRPFEALACGIPLVSAPWEDSELLFRAGIDYLVASSGEEMRRHLRDVLNDPSLSASLADSGRRTVLERHTCGHRAVQLLEIARDLGAMGDAGSPRMRAWGTR
jgi:spore maturation protein CgeB